MWTCLSGRNSQASTVPELHKAELGSMAKKTKADQCIDIQLLEAFLKSRLSLEYLLTAPAVAIESSSLRYKTDVTVIEAA